MGEPDVTKAAVRGARPRRRANIQCKSHATFLKAGRSSGRVDRCSQMPSHNRCDVAAKEENEN